MEHIFGQGGARRIAETYAVDVLGSLPLDKAIREHSDEGLPIVVADPENPVSLLYRQIAALVDEAVKDLDSSLSAPKISIMDD